MAIRITCPHCKASFQVADDKDGKTLRCTKCQNVFTASAEKPEVRAGAPKTSPASARSKAGSDSEREKPRAESKRRVNDDDDDEDSIDEPKRSNKKARGKKDAKSKTGLIVGLAAGGGIAVIGIVVLMFFLFRSGDGKKANNPEPIAKADGGEPKVVPAPPGVPVVPPATDPPKTPPDTPLPAQIDGAKVAAVKKATVYIRVQMPRGGIGEGTGFLAGADGLVVTNAHVVGMLSARSTRPAKIEIVLNSGEPDELQTTGQVLDVDRATDLALIRINADRSKLPPVLPLHSARTLSETQKVYIFGFPYGEKLGKNISVSESSVSSIRKLPSGDLERIQVNGGMNPGNSGGPVVDARGAVVGVAVAGIVGTNINFAIPVDSVLPMFDGRVSSLKLSEPYLENASAKIDVSMECSDPLKRVKSVRLDTWVGDPGAGRPASLIAPVAFPGDGARSSVPCVIQRTAEAEATATAVLQSTIIPAGKALWVQPVIETEKGTRWGSATPQTVGAAWERSPATIKLDYDQIKERTVNVRQSENLRVGSGKKARLIRETAEAEALEMVSHDKRGGAGVRLVIGSTKLTGTVGERTHSLSSEGQRILKGWGPNFYIDESGTMKERGDPNIINALPLEYREDVRELYNMSANAFESATLPTPNKQVSPNETWNSKHGMMYIGRSMRMFMDFHLTFKYMGKRNFQGRNEALVAFNGIAKTENSRTKKITDAGPTTGKGIFDLDKGYWSKVELVILMSGDSDLDDEISAELEMAADRHRGTSRTLKWPKESEFRRLQRRPRRRRHRVKSFFK
ncbi:MAG: trypsin-like peptidase domain-containing protein [Gemmataceae bacterium]